MHRGRINPFRGISHRLPIDTLSVAIYVCSLAFFGISSAVAVAANYDPALIEAYKSRIINTPHNFTRLFNGNPENGGNSSADFICIYCHTPPTNDSAVAKPLWSRATPAEGYVLNKNAAISSPENQNPGTAGAHSLTCLSCHDGMLGNDLMINVVGFSRQTPVPTQGELGAFLGSWPKRSTARHAAPIPGNVACVSCHNIGDAVSAKAYAAGVDFPTVPGTAGLNLEHSVGVPYPMDGRNREFNIANGRTTDIAFFDTNGNNRPDDNEVRLFRSETGYTVECASCHNPHGIIQRDNASETTPSFMRVTGDKSEICRICHVK